MALAQDDPLGPIDIFDTLHFLDEFKINAPQSSIFFLVAIDEGIKVIDEQFIIVKSQWNNTFDVPQVIVEQFVSQGTKHQYT